MKTIVWGSSQLIIIIVPLLVALCMLIIYRYRRAIKLVDRITAQQWRETVLKHFNSTKLLIKSLLLVLGFVLLGLSFLQPRWGKKDQVVHQKGRDVVIALDISRSMLAQDIQPSRLEHAKNKIERLLNLLTCERVALIVFSSASMVQCPLTQDFSTFKQLLQGIDQEATGRGTTAIDTALQKALDIYATLEKQGNPKKTKLLVLITDGEDFSCNLDSVKSQVGQLGVHVYTLGIGTEQGAKIPIYDGHGSFVGFLKDDQGKEVVSKRNEGILRALAFEAGGKYIASTSDDRDVRAIVKEIRKFEKEHFEDKEIQQYKEQYPWFVAGAFCCFALEWIL